MGIANAEYPTTQKVFTEKVDHVTEVIAQHVNALQDEVSSIEAFVGLRSDMPTVPGSPAPDNVAARLHGLLTLINGKASLVHSHDGVYAPVNHGHGSAGSSVARIGAYSTLTIKFTQPFLAPPVVVITNGDYNAAPYHLALVDGTITTEQFLCVAVPMMPGALEYVNAVAEWVSNHRTRDYIHTHQILSNTEMKDGHRHDLDIKRIGYDTHSHKLEETTARPALRWPKMGDPVRVNWIAMPAR